MTVIYYLLSADSALGLVQSTGGKKRQLPVLGHREFSSMLPLEGCAESSPASKQFRNSKRWTGDLGRGSRHH